MLLATCLVAGATWAAEAPDGKAQVAEVRKVWDAAPHNAFTDLARFKDKWFLTFREGKGHVSPDGAIRVLSSDDGTAWASAARLTLAGADLRDPKLSLTADGRLMILAAAARPREGGGGVTHQSMVWFSADGATWSDGHDVGPKDVWLWRAAWHGDKAYAAGYSTGSERLVRLFASADGARTFEPVADLFRKGYPNEAAFLWPAADTALCLLRRDGQEASAQLGTAKAPYDRWTWKDLGVKIGGPAMIRRDDGRLFAVVRLYDGRVRTAVCSLDAEAGRLQELLALPSGGDTSYAGLVFHDGLLWISYYSSHEGKTSIYVAKVRLP